MKDEFSTRTINPSIAILRNDFKERFIDCDNTVSEYLLTNSVSALYHNIAPSIFALELINGKMEVLTMTNFLSALYQFFCCDAMYPVNGPVAELQGKSFTQLPRNIQESFSQSQIKIILFDVLPGNKKQEEAYRNMVCAISKLN